MDGDPLPLYTDNSTGTRSGIRNRGKAIHVYRDNHCQTVAKCKRLPLLLGSFFFPLCKLARKLSSLSDGAEIRHP